MRQYALTLIAATLMLAACGEKQPASQPTKNETQQQDGDSTLYGLACDGCTDTLLVLLRNADSDPDTFNILNASRRHKVFGQPRIGDQLAVVVNSQDSTVADIVIDLEELKGQWCYTVMPELRKRAGMTERAQMEALPDSLLSELMKPVEYGFQIKSGHAMRPVGVQMHAPSTDEESPVVYPQLKRYRQWNIFNGRLVMHELALDSLGVPSITVSDTADFKLLQRDTLVLRFRSGDRGYYRKE